MKALPLIVMILSLGSKSMANKHRDEFNNSGHLNRVVGSWRIVSATTTNATGIPVQAYGPNPVGFLIFAEDFVFAETIINPDIPRLPNDDRAGGSLEDYVAIARGAIGNSGTYSVDGDGAFTGDRIVASTFPNFVGRRWSTDALNVTASSSGSELMERFVPGPDSLIEITWRRVTPQDVS
ncbi:MAG: hypothetical protein Q9222_001134 [Ikaeria aurantiellina]